ncbi:oocyte zinc finger protein XlCOF6-like [Bombyx mandarina]|uniref:Oocyte zinc finger protein XlCOF6-like n=1 Tax=Bombyx mandarina TaxID=7092 RepID=A0A6J2KNM9_BOMMA|nr:oocyte zinc finger protein XlCOF6-like [Bombyx mandarina]
MVCYCCVKGCTNNSKMKKKDPNSNITFHAFPTNSLMKAKWVKAIGRSNWDPPAYARICSIHFDRDYVNYENCRTRIKDDAIPVLNLPLSSNFDASEVKVCRICLANDVKMYSTQEGRLKSYMEQILVLREKLQTDGLPQFVCYMCAAEVGKCCKLIEKSVVAQATLLDVFARNGMVTKDLIRRINRKQLNLCSSLSTNNQTHYYVEHGSKNQQNRSSMKFDFECKNGEINVKLENHLDAMVENSKNYDTSDIIDGGMRYNDRDNISVGSDCSDDKSLSLLKKTKSLKSRDKAECPICKLRFKSEASVDLHRRHTHKKKFQYKSCPKTLSDAVLTGEDKKKRSKQPVNNERALNGHRDLSEPKRLGTYRCDNCNVKFVSKGALRVHLLTSSRHSSKVTSSAPSDSNTNKTCKICLKEYELPSELLRHVLTDHRKRRLKETYPTNCEHCNKMVSSRREHWWHTYKEHPEEKDSYRRVIAAICDVCGKGFQNKTKLRIHELRHASPSVRCDVCGRAFYDKYALARHAHTHTRARPFVCTHCGQTFTLRTNLNRHAKPTYDKYALAQHAHTHTRARPFVCTHCGQTFTLRTNLNRHAKPTYDKYALARHAHTHTRARPFVCTHCGQTFTLRTNLNRHAKVHSNVAAYQCPMCCKKFKYSTSRNLHIRTVHYKLPTPPRKKRTKTSD